MIKNLVISLLLLLICSCGIVDKKVSTRVENSDNVEEVDTVEIEDHPIFNPYTNKWCGKGSARINRAWCNHVYLDTIEHKWKWAIPDAEIKKMRKDDVKLVDSLILKFNSLQLYAYNIDKKEWLVV